MVDLGAETTTVAVYFKNILRHLAVIPLGGANITKDIASLQMEEADAERMKLKYASAYTDNNDIDNTLMLSIDAERQIESRKFIEIVEARVEEIIENVWFQVPAEYVNSLLGGIVLTGGGSNLKNIETAFRNHTHVDKIRTAKFIIFNIHSNNEEVNAHDGTMNTVLGILAKGDMNCAGPELTTDLFSVNQEGTTTTTTNDLHQKARTLNETTGSGVVRTEIEKQKAEEEERRKKESQMQAALEQQRQEEERLARERRENSTLYKAMKGLKGFFQKMISEDE